jgi:hypothetical protein
MSERKAEVDESRNKDEEIVAQPGGCESAFSGERAEIIG